MDNSKDISKLAYGDVISDKYSKLRFEIMTNLLKPFITRGMNIKMLDVGCYTGDLLKILPHAVNYYGVDNDEEALRIAQMRGAKVFRLDIERQGLSAISEKFDIIIATEILEHLKDPQDLLRQIKDLLRDDGIVLISLPNECTIYHRLKVLIGKGIDGTGFAQHYHLHFPTMAQNNQFIESNFRIIRRRYWVHTDVGGTLGRVLKKMPDRFWLGLADLNPSLFARGVIYLCSRK
jgi:2-polyprenyl-3-methyl-5-hydroxy-6-metoxy-1,4-benzoquinol methylase